MITQYTRMHTKQIHIVRQLRRTLHALNRPQLQNANTHENAQIHIFLQKC